LEIWLTAIKQSGFRRYKYIVFSLWNSK
jgi:hypothetical protein